MIPDAILLTIFKKIMGVKFLSVIEVIRCLCVITVKVLNINTYI